MTDHDPPSPAAISDLIQLGDYRYQVSRMYGEVRDLGVGEHAWEHWRAARTALLLTHPESPLVDRETFDEEAMQYFDYDPSWHLVASVEPLSPTDNVTQVQGGSSLFSQVGWVLFERANEHHRLALFSLDAYGGGLFLPFRDTTNGITTYGAGRYLLDGAKSADLGSPGPNELLLDFNFSYHPSCVWDPQWPCPLAPPVSHLTIAVEAGEKKPRVPDTPRHGARCERCDAWMPDGAIHDCC